jgi:hypothetical protein
MVFKPDFSANFDHLWARDEPVLTGLSAIYRKGAHWIVRPIDLTERDHLIRVRISKGYGQRILTE